MRITQEMGERGSAAEILAEVLCRALQRLRRSQSVAEELVQALEPARMHAKESQGRQRQAMGYRHAHPQHLSNSCSRTASPSTVILIVEYCMRQRALSIAAAHARWAPSIGLPGNAGMHGSQAAGRQAEEA